MKKIYITLAIVLLAVLAIFLVKEYNKGSFWKSDSAINKSNGKLVTGSSSETFSGTITAVDTGCFADAICSVSVDGKKVILVKGGRGQDPNFPVGKLLGVDSIGDLEKKIGSHANVYATTTGEGDYSLYGNNNYYVEVVDIK